MRSFPKICMALSLCTLQIVGAIEIDFKSADSIKKGASTIAYDMMTYYQGNITGFKPGVLPAPYYWWQSGAMWGSLINYWHFTGDSTYNSVVSQGMLFQVGDNEDYMPKEHRASLGNDDQGFWAVSALMAAETNFPDPPPGKPTWLGLAQAVFNEQIARWDNKTCGGGLRWQVYIKNGYDLKNTISNGLLFQIASRLARYTGDKMYEEWAVKVWDWMWRIELIDHESWNVYDNSEADVNNCSRLEHTQWSYNAGVLLGGASTMYDITGRSELWRNRTQNLLNRIETFFFATNNTMIEVCERSEKCNDDQRSFKAYLSRWMTSTSQLAPFTHPQVHRLLTHSALGASSQCTGGPSSTRCGVKWFLNGTFEGEIGVGQQMSALEVVLSTLVALDVPSNGTNNEGSNGGGVKPPVTGISGGTSEGRPNAGAGDNDTNIEEYVDRSTVGDKAGAWVITGSVAIMAVVATWFLISEALEGGAAFAVNRKNGSRREKVIGRGGNGDGNLGVDKEIGGSAGADSALESIGEHEVESGNARGMPKYRGGNVAT